MFKPKAFLNEFLCFCVNTFEDLVLECFAVVWVPFDDLFLDNIFSFIVVKEVLADHDDIGNDSNRPNVT